MELVVGTLSVEWMCNTFDEVNQWTLPANT